MTSALGGFFGGSKGITWPDQPPKTISGTILAVHPPEAVQDPKTGQPTDRQQVRIELSTTERDPEIQFDDGARTLYVKSYMRSAVGQALRSAGVREPEVGAHMTVTFVRTEAPDRPGLSASKHFEVTYTPGTPGVADHFGTAPPAPAPAPVQPVAQPAPVPQPVAVPPAVASIIAKPEGISDVAWAAMDDATKVTLAAAMSNAAPPPY